MIRFLSMFVVAAAVLAAVGSSPERADAAAFVVDRFDDPTPNTPRCTSAANDCSLREAILAANASFGRGDQITLKAGRYNLARTGAGTGGGDLDITGPLTVNGAIGRTIIDANDIDRVFDIACSASCYVEFNRLQIRDGLLNGEGGGAGIRTNENVSLSLNSSLVTSNRVLSSAQESYGAGIRSSGNLGVGKSTVSFNVGEGAAAFGGGIFHNGSEFNVVESTVGNNSASWGGGLYITGGAATVVRSAIVSNTTTASAGGVYSGNPLQLINSTLSGNSAAVNGGGLYVAGPGIGSITIENATIKGNSAALGDGIYHDSDRTGSLSYKHTIFDNIVDPGADANCYTFDSATLSSLGKNIFTDASCPKDNTSDFPYFSDPKLGPRKDNGGLSVTHAPQPGSPALNGGFANEECAGPRDQRGLLRPVGTFCDIGAFEAQVCFPGEGESYYLGFETISGTRLADNLQGTAGRDVIITFGGADTISGLNGNDRICAGSGNDTLDGDGGTDRLDGGSGTDTCDGGPPDVGELRVSCESGIP